MNKPARSISPAKLNKVASSFIRPISCIPIGKPFLLMPTGTDMAGNPVILPNSEKPEKSCHVFGCGLLLISSFADCQCADIMTMARGFGRFCPIRASALVVADCSIASVGAPCEINSAGSLAALDITADALSHAAAEVIGVGALS